MKHALFALILIFNSLKAHAASEIDFLNSYATASRLQRTAEAYDICTELLGLWPAEEYRQRILAAGNAWTVNPEAAYFLLSTCQKNWELNYLNPVKAAQTKKSLERIEFGQYVASLDLVDGYQFLREKVALFLRVKTYSDPSVPPSPYEILSGMASSERELDEVLQTQMRKVATSVTLAGGGIALAISGTKGFKERPKFTVKSLSGGIQKVVIVAVLSYLAGEAADALTWQWRASDLAGDVARARNNLSNARIPHGVALDIFAKAVERLGYFYSYDLYLRDGGKETHPYQSDDGCAANLRNFFTDKNVKIDSNRCQDAASLWINASQYINRIYQNDPIARDIADGLMAKAKHSVWSFEESRATLNIAPYAQPSMPGP